MSENGFKRYIQPIKFNMIRCRQLQSSYSYKALYYIMAFAISL